MTPWLSCIVPTCGRDTLARTLKSVRLQAPATEVEIVCVGDSHADTWREALARAPALCAQYEARYVEYDDGGHCVGHGQREYGQQQATGEWLLWSQDDSMLLDGALGTIRRAVQQGPAGPRLCRVQTWQAGVVWAKRLLRLGNVDADGIVTPNVPAQLGTWERVYTGDYTFIAETVERWGRVEWVDAIIARGRPKLREDWTAWR